MSATTEIHEERMALALSLAETAAGLGEVPVGAVITCGSRVVGTGYNLREGGRNALLHAEIMAIESACQRLDRWRLSDCVMYVTLEPCVMCAGAIGQARLQEVWYGTADPKGGALGSLYRIHEDARLNHRYIVHRGPGEEEAAGLLRRFFRERRTRNTENPSGASR